MKEKRRTPNPDVDEQELINQVHMRTMSGAMGLMTPPAPIAELTGEQKENDIEMPPEPLETEQKTKAARVGRPPSSERNRTAQLARDYDSTFLVSNVLDARKATYIGAEVHNLTKWVVDNVAPIGTSIGGYITRVMEQHYADNWNTDKNLYDADDTGQGYTSEELFDAVSVVMGAKKRKEDRKKVGEVLSHFDGAPFTNQGISRFKDNSPGIMNLNSLL